MNTPAPIGIRIKRDGRTSGYTVTAQIENNGQTDSELAVQLHCCGRIVADLFFTVEPDTGRPVVLVSAGGNPNTHRFKLHPLNHRDNAIETINLE